MIDRFARWRSSPQATRDHVMVGRSTTSKQAASNLKANEMGQGGYRCVVVGGLNVTRVVEWVYEGCEGVLRETRERRV